MINDPHGSVPVLHGGATLSEATLAVVLLHGRGGSAEDILGLASEFALDGVAYVAPQAAGHSWYPLSFLAPRDANEPFLGSALAKVAAVVASVEQAGFKKEQIVIAGFSQGACLSTEFVAAHPARYGGLIAFTGGLIGEVLPDRSRVTGLDGMPALMLSGDPDPHVPWTRVEASAATLRAMGAHVVEKRYPGRPHSVSRPEVDLARALLLAARDRSVLKG